MPSSRRCARGPGGEYVYLREAFGPLAGFLAGWTSFVAGFSGAIAAGAVGFRRLPGTAPARGRRHGALGRRAARRRRSLSVSPQALVALAVIGVLTAVHLVGLGPGRLAQNVLAVMKVALLVAFVAAGFVAGQGSTANFSEAGEAVSGAGWLLAPPARDVCVHGLERRHLPGRGDPEPGPQRPRSPWGWGTTVVVVIYMFLNLLYVYALPVTEFGAAGHNGGRRGPAPVRSGRGGPGRRGPRR